MSTLQLSASERMGSSKWVNLPLAFETFRDWHASSAMAASTAAPSVSSPSPTPIAIAFRMVDLSSHALKRF